MDQRNQNHPLTAWACWIALFCLTAGYPAVALALSPEEEIETLDMVEITGTAVQEKGRDIIFPLPTLPLSGSGEYRPNQRMIDILERQPVVHSARYLLDPTAHRRGTLTQVKAVKAEHPPYPRQAREQGWHGVVVIQVHISKEGHVEEATVKESSGFPLLDTSAIQSVKQWKFSPAKNGNFPVPATANVPIKFDLRQ